METSRLDGIMNAGPRVEAPAGRQAYSLDSSPSSIEPPLLLDVPLDELPFELPLVEVPVGVDGEPAEAGEIE